MKEPPHLTDWSRILLGQVPLSYLVEALIRCVFIYLLLIVSMRLLGRRMASQMNVTELTAMVSLAAAVGIPLLSPDRGLLPSVVIAVVIVSIGRLSARLATRSAQAEAIIDGQMGVLVEDGVLQLEQMKSVRVTRERLFARLRTLGLKHLGAAKRVYFESSGNFSVVPVQEARSGLSIIPDWDVDFVREQKPSTTLVCDHCGARKPAYNDEDGECRNCGGKHWVAAIS